ncbi:MAG: PspA/IM30 family protein [Leptolyngbyaceae bacterium]|nr:PspA/IM30 family protein [Leptolyngbyaceae bacterium]
MSIFDRLARLIRATINSWLGKQEDPEKILQQTVMDMENDLISLRQSVAQAIATQKRTERQASQAETVAEEWYRRAELALKQGEENMAREALARRKTYLETANTLSSQLGQQANIVNEMKANMRKLEGKLSEAKVKKDMYIARARSAQASQQLNEMMGGLGAGSSTAAFERMGEKVAQMEAQAAAVAELSSDSLEQRFAELEGGNELDAELDALRTRIASSDNPQLPSS